MLNTAPTRMVADLGGTNCRIALYDPQTGEFRALSTYVNRRFPGLREVLGTWLKALDEPAPIQGCIAVAAPPGSHPVTMVNINWSFSIPELAEDFGFERLLHINDFQAIAYALPHLQAGDRHTLCTGETARASSGILAAVGPGTGLGGATLAATAGPQQARACEPGHMGLSPGNELELELFALLLRRFGNVHAELLVSGPGLRRLYETLAEIRGEPTEAAMSPAAISRAAIEENHELCRAALAGFCALLGSVCGDFALANGAYGGLYLAGGIVPGIIPFLAASDFHHRFCAKGAMADHLARVPVHVITAEQPGLLGAAHASLK